MTCEIPVRRALRRIDGVKSVDVKQNTITITRKSEKGAEEKTVTLIPEAKIILDGLRDVDSGGVDLKTAQQQIATKMAQLEAAHARESSAAARF